MEREGKGREGEEEGEVEGREGKGRGEEGVAWSEQGRELSNAGNVDSTDRFAAAMLRNCYIYTRTWGK